MSCRDSALASLSEAETQQSGVSPIHYTANVSRFNSVPDLWTPKDCPLCGAPRGEQRELSADGHITQRAFCCSPEVQLGEDNGQADSGGND
ncbi:hypothetical protein FQA47_014378 [Oryzias melastigma]|uniref:Uncharacterized protein n=1 Tax=Oryzias melastigma TaxID=30732 RepID=A0A834CGX9_ORYME|nr:hypothetical protein FQA47_014378 [Oryzias melastigma]